MSGHSKWSKIKHQKAVTDVVKAKAFTKASRAITVAVIEGQKITDPNKNFRLRLAIELAKRVNMPKDTIDRAIAKGAGGTDQVFESLLYEAYGVAGVAMLIEVTTDNRTRSASQIKNSIERNGGTLASPGAVAYMFEKRGLVVVDKPGVTSEEAMEVALEASARDVVASEDGFEVWTDVAKIHETKEYLEQKGYSVNSAEIIYYPTVTVSVSNQDKERIESLVASLEDNDDVQTVHTNLI